MSRLDGRLLALLHAVEGLAADALERVLEPLPAVRGAADAAAIAAGAARDGEEERLLDDALHEADAEGRVAAVDVRDVVGLLLVDFFDDESEDFAEVGVVRFCALAVAAAAAADGVGDQEGVGRGSGVEELHLFEGVEGEEVLVAVGVEDEAFEVIEIFGTDAA